MPLTLSLEYFKLPNAIKLLTELCEFNDDEARENSAESILKPDRHKGAAILNKYFDDKIIANIVAKHSGSNFLYANGN